MPEGPPSQPPFSPRATLVLGFALAIPFSLRSATTAEPYPAVLFPAGAGKVSIADGAVTVPLLKLGGHDGQGLPRELVAGELLAPRPPWLGKAGLALVAGAGLCHFAMRVAGRGSALLFAGAHERRWSLYLSIPTLAAVILLIARDLTGPRRARAVGDPTYLRRSPLPASPRDPS